ncbi:type II secretion system F family protein [Coraliomargarita sp. SDUM461004]|uniref:Type II secretion system F family protein n=1 Tax=Thalassobacterium sedimentorum TaxID=3041258 RepID=A0ABU1AG05_9BACT|nr:type II secretion system F family protein [Coraliomargarita sp. SDUM461004]MDQ8193708.1 type II secretion system F family protein [Coraliomargarita sp. SDUM461004]
MPSFNYRALASKGKYENGRIEAASSNEVRRLLRERGLNPIEISATTTSNAPVGGNTPRTSQKTIKKIDLNKLQLSQAKSDKLSLAFLEKVYQLVESGLPLGDAVKSLNQRLTEPTLHAISEELWRDLSEGATLADAMRRRPALFDPTITSMIEAGEATGNLQPILQNIIDLLEARIQLRKEILSGLSYPAFLLVVVFFVLLFVLFYLMPKVEQMLDSMGGELSIAAKLIIGLANFSLTGGPVILVLLLVLGVVIFQWRKSTEGRLACDRALLRTPVIKSIVHNAELSRLSNLASILLESGVDTTDALKLLEKSFQNEDIRLRFKICRSLISDGASFSASFQNQNIVEDMDADVLSISENTGSLVKGFNHIYRNRHLALSEQMKRLTTVISTGALLFVFSLVALVVFGVVSSIMQLSSSVLGG